MSIKYDKYIQNSMLIQIQCSIEDTEKSEVYLPILYYIEIMQESIFFFTT